MKELGKNGPAQSKQLTTVCLDWTGPFNLAVPNTFDAAIVRFRKNHLRAQCSTRKEYAAFNPVQDAF